jgi:hypothetical protein
MKRKLFWTWAVLAIALLFSSSNVAAQNSAKPELRLTISVYNDANVSGDTLQQAEGEAVRVFRRAGVEVQWLNCEATAPPQESAACREVKFPAHLHLRIVRKALRLKAGVLGISFLAADGTGCQADLFYERMEELQNTRHGGLASLLGHVAAHEVGHLLLGTNSHAPTGIMRGHWTDEEVAGINLARLYFSPAESERMRERLSSKMQAEKHAPGLMEARTGD